MKLLILLGLIIVIALSGCSSAQNSAANVDGGLPYSSSSSSGIVAGPPPKVDLTDGAQFLLGEAETTTDLVESSFFYFSYDDSSSTASHDLAQFYIRKGLSPLSKWGRSYEYLNAETFDHFQPSEVGPFQVSLGLVAFEQDELPILSGNPTYSLGVNVTGPELTKDDRPNIVATFLLDVSGSMSTRYAQETREDIQTLLDIVKYGLKQMVDSLKPGDVINIVSFDTEARDVLLEWNYDLSQVSVLTEAIDSIRAQGSTNLDGGIRQAYRAAQMSFDSGKSNRVIILTDAYANKGEVDPEIIASSTVINGLEGIYFSGIGIGYGFDDTFLNELTEIGRGHYSAMITPEDSERIFGKHFTRFIDDAVVDIRFKLDYPNSFLHQTAASSAEQISKEQDDVKTINFAYNSHQFFLEHFSSSEYDVESVIALEISYLGESGERVTKTLEKTVGDLLALGEDQIKSAVLVTALSEIVGQRLTCSSAEGSSLFGQFVETYIFEKYHNLISSLCRW